MLPASSLTTSSLRLQSLSQTLGIDSRNKARIPGLPDFTCFQGFFLIIRLHLFDKLREVPGTLEVTPEDGLRRPFPTRALWEILNISALMRCANDVNFSFGRNLATSAIPASFVNTVNSTSVCAAYVSVTGTIICHRLPSTGIAPLPQYYSVIRLLTIVVWLPCVLIACRPYSISEGR